MFPTYFLFFISNLSLFLVITGLPENPPCNEVPTQRYSSLEMFYADVKRGGLRSLTAIDEDSWHQVICGEWLVLLCSQLDCECMDLKRILQRLPDTVKDVGLAFGDLSKETALQTRMHALDPITLYHVIDGDFRRLKSQQDVFSLRDLLLLRQWTEILPVMFWKQPSSLWTSWCVFFSKVAVKLLKSGYVGHSYYVATWWITFVLAGMLTTGLWSIYLLWCKILRMCHYWKRQQDSYPALLSATDEDFTDS